MACTTAEFLGIYFSNQCNHLVAPNSSQLPPCIFTDNKLCFGTVSFQNISMAARFEISPSTSGDNDFVSSVPVSEFLSHFYHLVHQACGGK